MIRRSKVTISNTYKCIKLTYQPSEFRKKQILLEFRFDFMRLRVISKCYSENKLSL